MKTIAYIRVSTTEQAEEGYSIPAQKNRLEAYALSQGWEIVQWYVDEGESAKDLNRTELKRMLKAIEMGIFDCVLVYRLDRLTRSVMDLFSLLNTFDKFNVKFKSATEVFDTTNAMGRLFITIVSALASWERENLGERVRMGMQQKAKEGKWTVANAPLGYTSNDSILSINPSEAAIVKEIYSLYLSGIGMHRIAGQLNERGLYPRSGKTWYQTQVSYVLKNPIYKGTTRYNYRVNTDQYFEVENVAPAIVTEEEFDLVQKMINSRSEAHPRQATSKFIFSKVLKCKRCGATLIGKTSTSKRREKVYHSINYCCPNRQRALCDLPSISQNLFEQKFIQALHEWDISREVDEITESEIAAAVEDHTETIKELEAELTKIEKRRDKWQYGWANDMINDLDFKKRLKEEDEKEKMILQELNKLTPTESDQDNNINELLSDLKLNWYNMTEEMKKQFVLIIFRSITVDKINSTKTPDSISIQKPTY